ncbi:Low molecular weight phosphotyrosine protein phosphatase [Saxophila tyrrhenica]|uniref:Low molecular weight phosphotyrosine protein phosphatase n=1 Tax=Saxophila tyrrhenica TaxID=1690608 RepID=A0AAV9P680_9PEZI|nr:Low molecular weight phosphotyrosine protein phosphatase [Saxophila tyrrhenica]
MPPTTRSEDIPSSTTSTAKPVSILFVCLGNICRSPMAEAHFRHLISHPSYPLISNIDSCGTGAYHLHSPPDPRTLSTLRRHNVDGYTHSARRVRVPEDFQEFDYVLGMDEENVEDLKDMVGRAVKKGVLGKEEGERAMGRVRLYGEFGGKGREEVQDPYYGAGQGFEIAFEQMGRFGKGLVEDIEQKAKKGDAEGSSEQHYEEGDTTLRNQNNASKFGVVGDADHMPERRRPPSLRTACRSPLPRNVSLRKTQYRNVLWIYSAECQPVADLMLGIDILRSWLHRLDFNFMIRSIAPQFGINDYKRFIGPTETYRPLECQDERIQTR